MRLVVFLTGFCGEFRLAWLPGRGGLKTLSPRFFVYFQIHIACKLTNLLVVLPRFLAVIYLVDTLCQKK